MSYSHYEYCPICGRGQCIAVSIDDAGKVVMADLLSFEHFKCQGCGYEMFTSEVMDRIREFFEAKYGTDQERTA